MSTKPHSTKGVKSRAAAGVAKKTLYVRVGPVQDSVMTGSILSPQEGFELFDAQARRHLNMGGDEFIQKWDEGSFKGEVDRPEVMRVVRLLPFARAH